MRKIILLIVVFLTLTPRSVYSQEIPKAGKTFNFSLRTATPIFKTNSSSAEETVRDFLSSPKFLNQQKLIPENFLNNSRLLKKSSDETDRFLKENGFNLSQDHFYYQQNIQGIPIYGSFLSLHIFNKNELKTLKSKLLDDYTLPSAVLTDTQARKIALKYTQRETNRIDLIIEKSSRIIFNKKLIGLSGDEKNYLTLSVEIRGTDLSTPFDSVYFVDLENGGIIYQQSLIRHAINRQIFLCPNGEPPKHAQCYLIKDETDTVAVDNESEKAFQYFGEVYNTLQKEFKLDSYNNKGAPLVAYINIWTPFCQSFPTAWWGGSYIAFCKGMVTRDTVGHEIGHGISEYIWGFDYWDYKNQSGAINESISDIFGYYSDSNWMIGEDDAWGVMRRMDDPTIAGRRGKSPDRLFSPYYDCSNNVNNVVHRNSGILNKIFYLMVTGGSGNFNGCQTVGIGRTKSTQILYRLLKTYLDPSPNYRDVYDSMLYACEDLYESNSSTCKNLTAILQSAEIDQQDRSVTSPKCNGVAPKTPQCVTVSKPGDANNDGKVDGVDYVIWLNHYNQTTNKGVTEGDFNKDSKVDGLDYVIWVNNTK